MNENFNGIIKNKVLLEFFYFVVFTNLNIFLNQNLILCNNYDKKNSFIFQTQKAVEKIIQTIKEKILFLFTFDQILI